MGLTKEGPVVYKPDEKSSILLAPLEWLVAWGRAGSLWPLTYATACCAFEMIHAWMPRYDFDRHGCFFRPTPRQCDVMLVAGTITKKMAEPTKLLYEQIPNPKWVIAMGACACSGGPFVDSYAVVKGVDKIIPVDIYVPGCPPRPEALMYAVMKLKEKIIKEKAKLGGRV
ncbi:MAG: NADH-quinone oxidoreductase subunit B [Caldiserica bacterium]|nr:NADH-quinone oxidoreductase subunit B [Caldisericota bacterium]